MERRTVSGHLYRSDREDEVREDPSGRYVDSSRSDDESCSPSAFIHKHHMWEWCLDWKKLLWKKRPAGSLLYINVIVALGVLVGEILIFESSTSSVRNRHHSTAIFPILVPTAVAFAFGCKWQGSAALPNFLGFFAGHIYVSARNGSRILEVRVLYFLVLSLVSTLQVQIGADFLTRKLCLNGRKIVPTIDTVHECLLYFVIVGVMSLCFETLSAVVECTIGLVEWSSFPRFWSTRWLGVLAALITIAPALIHSFAYAPRYAYIFRSRKLVECLVLVICTVSVMGLVIFSLPFTTVIRPLPYLLYPLVMFSVFRFNRFGWTLVVACISYFGAWGSLHYKSSALYYTSGSSARSSPKLLLQIELFMAVLGMVAISLAGAVREKKQLTKDLHNLNHRLEDAVSRRTQELIRANNDLQISQAHAEKANLAKSDFLANMSHEIRTPIHGILGLTALLLQTELSSDQLENLSSVKDCADLLLHIINSILDLAKIEAGRLEVETVPFSIRKVVIGTLRMMQVRAKERGLQLLWKVDVNVPSLIAGDPGKLQQCLLNLVGNALKFTHRGSVWVHISLHPGFESSFSQVLSVRKEPMKRVPRKSPSFPARLRSWASWPGSLVTAEIDEDQVSPSVRDMFSSYFPDNSLSSKGSSNKDHSGSIAPDQASPEIRELEKREYVLIEVTDTGIGMSEDSVREMFNPFTQADASTSRLYGGTGLGLSIVQRFVELLGGKIWVESEIGKGSMFSFVVPFNRVECEEDHIGRPQSSIGLPPMTTGVKPTRLQRQPTVQLPTIGKGRRAHSLNTLMKNLKFSLPQFSDVEPLLHMTVIDKFKDSVLKHAPSILITEVDARKERSESMGGEGLGIGDKPGPSCRIENFTGISKRNHSALPKLTSTEIDFVSKGRLSDSKESQRPVAVIVDSSGLEKSDTLQPSNCHPVGSGGNTEVGPSIPRVPDRELVADNLDGYHDLEMGISAGSMFENSSYSSGDINSSTQEGLLPSVSQFAVHKLAETSDANRSTLSERDKFQMPLSGKKNFHVLLAEDNMINQKVATQQLKKYGHTVTIVGDGLQALNAVQLNHDTFDLVLMDIQMPMMDGLEATRKIRAEESKQGWHRLPILGLTAHAISGYQETCLSHGMDAYLGKPFEISQLLNIINQFI